MVIGVTGKYCAGKNLVTSVLEERGFEVIDVDALGHEALIRKKEEIVEQFGRGILADDGSIDRKKLGERVFADPAERSALEALVHPWMKEQVRKEIERTGLEGRRIINAALLYYMNLHPLCDLVFWVRAPLATRFLRAMKRDGLSWFQVLRRFCSQSKLSAQSGENDVDIYYIDNSRGAERVRRQVDRVLAKLE